MGNIGYGSGNVRSNITWTDVSNTIAKGKEVYINEWGDP